MRQQAEEIIRGSFFNIILLLKVNSYFFVILIITIKNAIVIKTTKRTINFFE